MRRITEIIKVGEDGEVLGYRINPFNERLATQKLAEYENAEEEGRLVVLPCNTVWFILDQNSPYAMVMPRSIEDLCLHEINKIDKDGRYWSSKEKAEKALKIMNNA